MSQLPTQIVPCNLVVQGTLSPAGFNAPAGSIGSAGIATPGAGAAGIVSSKLNHRFKRWLGQAEGAAVVSQTEIVSITYGTAGAIVALQAILKVACAGAATISVDLKKNGTSVLASPISFSSSDSALTVKSATPTTTTTAAGDYFEIVITATAGGGTLGQGIYAEAIIDENPS